MRIAMVAQSFPPQVGGIETHVARLSSELSLNGHSVTVIAGSLTPNHSAPHVEQHNGFTVERYRSIAPNHTIHWMPGLRRMLRRRRTEFDVVHLHGYNSLTSASGIAAWKDAGPPRVLTLHSANPQTRTTTALHLPYSRWFKAMAGRLSAVVYVSNFERMRFHDLIPSKIASHVIPNGVDPLPDTLTQQVRDPFEIVSLGRLEKYKRHDLALRAFAKARSSNPNLKLVIIGKGSDEGRLRRVVENEQIQGVCFVGGLSRSEYLSALSRAGLIMILSSYESQGIAAIEASLGGAPMLISDNSALSEIARLNRSSAIPEDCPAETVARMILSAVANPKRFVIPAHAITWGEVAKRTEDVYLTTTRRG